MAGVRLEPAVAPKRPENAFFKADKALKNKGLWVRCKEFFKRVMGWFGVV